MLGYLTFLQILPHPDDGEGQSGLLLLASTPGLGVLLVLGEGSGVLISFHISFLLSVLLHLSVLLVRDGFLRDGLGLGGPPLLLGDLGWFLNRNILRENRNSGLGATALSLGFSHDSSVLKC